MLAFAWENIGDQHPHHPVGAERPTGKSSSKKTQTQPKQKSKPRPPRVARPILAPRLGAEEVKEYITASINPFLEAGRGAKIPDENVLPSVPLTAMDEYVLSSDSNGRAAVTILPFLRNHYCIPAITAGAYNQPYDWTASQATYYDSQSYTEAQAVFLDSRTVAAGVQLSVVSPSLTTAGRLFAGFTPLDFEGKVLGDLNRPTSVSEMLYTYKFHEISLPDLVHESVIIPFPTIDIGSTRYRSSHFPTLQAVDDFKSNSLPDGSGYENTQTVLAGSTLETMCGWPVLCIFIEGCAANTPTLLIETVVHTENLVRTNGHIITSSPAALPASSALEWVARHHALADGWLRENAGTTLNKAIMKGVGVVMKHFQ